MGFPGQEQCPRAGTLAGLRELTGRSEHKGVCTGLLHTLPMSFPHDLDAVLTVPLEPILAGSAHHRLSPVVLKSESLNVGGLGDPGPVSTQVARLSKIAFMDINSCPRP